MTDRRKKYDFENLVPGEEKFFPCKKGDRDRLRNSLQTAARAKNITLKCRIDESGISYWVPKKDWLSLSKEDKNRIINMADGMGIPPNFVQEMYENHQIEA